MKALNRTSIARIRIERNLSQAQFAAALDVSVSTIQSIEGGRLVLSDRLALRISEVFGVDPKTYVPVIYKLADLVLDEWAP